MSECVTRVCGRLPLGRNCEEGQHGDAGEGGIGSLGVVGFAVEHSPEAVAEQKQAIKNLFVGHGSGTRR